MFGVLDVSTSALIAQRTRLEVISANLANRFSLTDAQGNYAPYRRRVPIMAAGDPASGNQQGVHVQQIELDPSAFRNVYDPGHPYADKNGYVQYPNVDPTIEQIDALEASRAYEASITAAEATKAMISASLRILA
jgi:flagellar basal-body rod protein FlgC